LPWRSKFPPKPVEQRVRIAHQSGTGGRDRPLLRDDARGSIPLGAGGHNDYISKRGRLLSKTPAQTEVVALANIPRGPTVPIGGPAATVAAGPFAMQPLPWLSGALAPAMSSRTVQVHHGSHHASCISLANRLALDHEELAHKEPLEIVCWARAHARDTELFTATSEAWNHALFWQSLSPSKKRPGGKLGRAIDREFGNFDHFAEELKAAGGAHLGSGWLWLAVNARRQLKILTTSGTDSPEYKGSTCLLAIDLWEHAYYFDHQSRRRDYLNAVVDSRLDWDFAGARYRLALERNANARRDSRRPSHQSRARGRKRSRSPAIH
jgi:Fe-Mn family superoxide dismutase